MNIPTIITGLSLLLLTTGIQKPDFISSKNWQTIQQGKIVINEIDEPRKGQTFEAMGLMPGTPEQTLAALQAYQDQPKFMPNVENIEIVKRNGSQVIVNQTLGLPMGQKRRYRLDTHVKKNDSHIKMSWKMIDWPEVPKNERIGDTEGYWLLYPFKENQTLAVYHVYTDPGDVPFGLGWIVEYLSGSSIEDILVNTGNYIKEHNRH